MISRPRIDSPDAFEQARLFAGLIKLFEREIAVFIDVAAQVNARADLLIEITAGELIARAHQFHLQVERRADRAFEVFGLRRRGVAARG